MHGCFFSYSFRRSFTSTSSSDDDEPRIKKKQRKLGPSSWHGVKIEKVNRVPDKIDGLKCYELTNDNVDNTRDGRRWKKASESQWNGYESVRFRDCWGSFRCKNEACAFKKEYSVTNSTQFDKKTNCCSVCGVEGKYVPCSARKYIVKRSRKLYVYHHGDHTCPCVPATNRATEDIHRKIIENPDATPAQIQSSLILSKMREGCAWSEVEQAAVSLSDKKWISNKKQEIKKNNEPFGHDFEAVAHFKLYTDVRDPYYLYELKYGGDKNDKTSFVFKTSKLKVQFALNMDRAGEHILGKEFCYFDGKVKRCKGFISLTASVYHPVLRKLVPLATMECSGENTATISLFWKIFNDALKKESGDSNYTFNPRGWITDMAGANMEGIKSVFGTSAVDRIKTCEFHFKDCRNRQARKLDEDAKGQFKRLCNALIEAESPGGYKAAKESIESFIGSDSKRAFLQSWFDWWDKRRSLIFPAFLNVQGGSKMNQAEAIHASWVKRDRRDLSLLDAAQADVRDNIQLEVSYKAFQNGSGKSGGGPSIQTQSMREGATQMRRARSLGLELIREDITDNDRILISENATYSNPHDKHNGSVQCGPRRSDGERNGRYRPSRSKTFLNKLRLAKEEKNDIKVKSLETGNDFEKSYTLVTKSLATYKVKIGKNHSCQCLDFSKNVGKDLCKHIIWILLNVCQIPEESELLQQVSLTEAECSEIFANAPPIPEILKYASSARNQTRQEMVTNLLMKDRRNCQPKVWVLKRKNKQKGTTPRCRGCRKEQNEGELCVSVVGLYVPFEQNFVVETTFYFCPAVECLNRIPPWVNLTTPTEITVDSSVSRSERENFRNSPLNKLLL